MLTHRLRLGALLLLALLAAAAVAQQPAAPTNRLPVAGLLASWFPNSHAEVLLGRVVRTYSIDDKGTPSQLQLASMYLDRKQPRDYTDTLAKDYKIRLSPSVEDALTLGTGKLAVSGVFLCTEWADYPKDARGATLYPHRRLFEETVKVFKASGKVVPVFVDKHLADNWADAWYIYKTAQDMKIPLMAGSTMPVAARLPEADVKKNAKLKEIDR